MEAADINDDVVHPEVRAHITNLVSALGGYSVDEDGSYKLGDEALDVLRDLKKWIRFYDEKTNRMDVARCLAEANLVGGDLLQILTLWPQNETDSKYKARIALACFEVMVPLTWPIEKERAEMTINHHRHMPVLQLAQLGYKRAIINFDAIPILNTAVRVALPSMAMPIGERTPRDLAIIKLILFFLRNVAMIAPPQGVKYEGDETQVSRSATIDAFSYQDIFLTLLTLASNMGEDFRTEDVIVMEIIFHLVKRVDPSSLFVSEKQLNKAKGQELASEMRKETAMLKSYNKTTTTRHSRFGTMIWVKRADGKMVTVSGQEALLDAKTRERKMDSSKTFRPPRRARKPEREPKDLGPPVTLDERARQQLRSFVQDFLDSGFNPLFLHVRQSIDREALHVLNQHKSQFFYLVAWFLEAERMRRKAKREESKSTSAAGEEVNSFNLVAAVLQQEMFASMNRALDRSYSDKDWQLLTSVMRCYTQIFLTVQEMSESPNEEDQEIAENTLSRLFYEETTHDLIANIARTYKDQGFEYLDAATELVHTFLRMLEGYSKQNVDLQVRSRKRARRKKKAAKAAAAAATTAPGEEAEDVGVPEENDADDSGDDEQHAERVTQERKFEFGKFAIRFAPQGVVDTFVALTKFYRDLNDTQLKRAHRYFYRVAFKQELGVMLFRLDIINLFYNMVKGPEPLDKNSPMFKEWEELSKQIIRKCVKKLQERPALFTELLFSKIGSTTHFLEHGYEKPVTTTTPRPGAELEFKRATERDEQIGIAVSVLIDKQQTEHLQWLKDQLTSAMNERQAWENVDKAMAATTEGAADGEAGEDSMNKSAPPHVTIRPDTEARRTAMFKNPHLRLLMRLVGMERLTPTLDETPDSTWILPGNHTAEAIQDTIDLINKAEFSPPTFEDGGSAEDQLRRKSAAASRRTRAAYDDDEEEIRGFLGDDDDEGGIGEDFLFAPGGPTARKPDARPQKKRQRRRRREAGSGDEEDEGVSDEVLAARAKKRREKELEKMRKIKSEMYVHASDDETDDERDREFFEREKKRQEAKDSTFDSMLGTLGLSVLSQVNGGEKSAWEAVLDDEDGSDGSEGEGGRSAKRRKKQVASDSEEEEEEEEDSDEELPTKPVKASKTKKKAAPKRPVRRSAALKKKAVVELSDDEEEEEEEEDEEEDAMDVDSDNERTTTKDAPPPSSPGDGLGRRINKMVMDDNDEDEDDQPVVAARQRPRARGGFVIDSSDEE